MKIAFVLAMLASVLPAAAQDLGLPAVCTPGKDCFAQQFSDLQPGPGVADPFCGVASYEGHDGTDLRILSMADMARGVAVLSMADGKVLRVRDGEPDRLVAGDADRTAVADKECGNGLVVDHGDGLEVQYCHLRQGSIAVKPGDSVARGSRLGDIGASGMAQFPHVHVSVRKDGVTVDPMTGRALADGCLKDGEGAKPLFAADVAAALGKGGPQLLAMGLAGAPIDYKSLVVDGPPAAASAQSQNLVGWGWFINLRKGDRIRIAIVGPDGNSFAENVMERLERSKADYSAFTGKRGKPRPGEYALTIEVWADSGAVLRQKRSFNVQ